MMAGGVHFWLGIALLVAVCQSECASSEQHIRLRRDATTEAVDVEPVTTKQGNSSVHDVQDVDVPLTQKLQNHNKTESTLDDNDNNILVVKTYLDDENKDQIAVESKEKPYRGSVKYVPTNSEAPTTTTTPKVPSTTASSQTTNTGHINPHVNKIQSSDGKEGTDELADYKDDDPKENTGRSLHHDTVDSKEYDDDDDTAEGDTVMTSGEKSRAGNERSFDIEKYVSPEFHNINNVYTHPTSPDVPDYPSSSWTNDHKMTIADIYNTELTTPRSFEFDKRQKIIEKEINDNLDIVDKQFPEPDRDLSRDSGPVNVESILSKVADNDTDVSINYLNSASIVVSDNKNPRQKSLVVQNGTNLDFQSNYIKTVTDKPVNIKEISTQLNYQLTTTTDQPIRSRVNSESTDPKVNDTNVQTATTKARVRISLRNNKISMGDNDSSAEILDSNEKNTIPKKPTLKWKPYFLSTPMPTNLDPLFEKNSTTTDNQSAAKNSVLNISKRGSTRYLDNLSTTSPKMALDDGQNFTIPPSATAWSLASMKNVPNTKAYPTVAADSIVQENQVYTVQVLPQSNVTALFSDAEENRSVTKRMDRGEETTTIAKRVLFDENNSAIFTTTTETVPTSLPKELTSTVAVNNTNTHPEEQVTTTTQFLATRAIQSNDTIISELTTTESIESTTQVGETTTQSAETETTPQSAETTTQFAETTFLPDSTSTNLPWDLKGNLSDVTSRYIEPTTYKPTYFPKEITTTESYSVVSTTNLDEGTTEQPVTTKNDNAETTTMFGNSDEMATQHTEMPNTSTTLTAETSSMSTETTVDISTHITTEDSATRVEIITRTEIPSIITEVVTDEYSTTIVPTTLFGEEDGATTPTATTMITLPLFESSKSGKTLESENSSDVQPGNQFVTNKFDTTTMLPTFSSVNTNNGDSLETFNNNSVYSQANKSSVEPMLSTETASPVINNENDNGFDIKFKVTTVPTSTEPIRIGPSSTTSSTTPQPTTTFNIKTVPTTKSDNIHDKILNKNISTDYDETSVEIIKYPELTTVPHNFDPKHEHKNIENDINKFSTSRSERTSTTSDSPITTETDSSVNNGETQDSDNNSGMIAAIVISSIAGVSLILLALLLIVMRKRQKRFNYGQRCTPVSLDAYSLDSVSVYNSVRRKGVMRASKRSYGNPAFEDPVSISHPMNFAALSTFASDTDGITKEYEEVPLVTAHTNEIPPGCETKNRYANVIPLPETRVFLSKVEGDPHSDYINANFVRGPRNAKAYYIATQAPMENTVDDFWKMIWEQQSKVILMLTDLVENNAEKCFDYLPPSEVLDCHRQFGDYQITLKKREVKDKYIISSLQLKNMVSNSWREVTHLWYLGWPERGVPEEANSMIAFLIEARSYLKTSNNHINTENENEKTTESANGHLNANGDVSAGTGPVTVHCSPGTGRTGTVVACDVIIREFELTRLVDVPKTVYRVRRDRASAVQTKDQYAFIYKVINLYATKLTGGAMDSI